MLRSASKDLELCNKATPGPWWIDGNGDIIQTKHITRDVWFIPKIQEDVKFIAESREALPYWINDDLKARELLKEALQRLNEGFQIDRDLENRIEEFLGGGQG